MLTGLSKILKDKSVQNIPGLPYIMCCIIYLSLCPKFDDQQNRISACALYNLIPFQPRK